MLIKDLIDLKSFDPVINLGWAGNINEQERLLSNYIMTEDLADIFVEMLESITMVRSATRRKDLSGDINSSVKRAHILSGQYGTGKSYFLLMLNIILEQKNPQLSEELINRFKNYPELQFQLNEIKGKKKYFVVRINGENENEKEFKDVIQGEVTKALEGTFDGVSLGSVFKTSLDQFERVVQMHKDKVEDYLLIKPYDIHDIRANLYHHKKEGIRQFEEVAEAATGFSVKTEIDKMEDFLKDVDKVLKSRGYDELVVVFDEFSAYISASMEYKRMSIDLGQIQNIAQLTSRSTDIDVSFIASTHKDLAEMVGNGGGSKREDLDKVFGRFQAHILNFDQGEELLKSTIEIVDQSSINNMFNKYKGFIDKAEEKFERKLLDFYPLHPATALFLEPISDRYAQKTRTTFTFLEEVIRKEFFNQPVEKDGKLNLITLTDLYNYFEKEIEGKDKELIKEFNQISTEVKEKELIEYTKALALAYSSSQTKMGKFVDFSSEEFGLLYQHNSEDVEMKLGRVAAENHINIQKINGKYRMFVNTSGINVDQLLSKEIEKINPEIVRNRILQKAEDRIFIKNNYNLKYSMGLYPMDRNLEGTCYTSKGISRAKVDQIFKLNGKSEGKIVVIIPEFTEEYNPKEIVEEYRESMRPLDDNVCLAVPKDIVFNENDLKEYGALLNLENNNDDISKNKDIKKMIVQRRRKLEDKIRNKYLRKFSNLRNFTFVFSKGKVKDDLRQDTALYKELLYTYYNKFPHEIKVENFSTRVPLNKLVKLFMDGSAEIPKKSKTSEEAKNIYATLNPLDLVKITEKVDTENIEFKAPNGDLSALSKEIMEIVEAEEKELSIGQKYSKLNSAPYGLNLPLIDLYFFITNKLARTYIVNKISNRPYSLDDKNLVKLSSKSSDYQMKKNELIAIPVKVKEVWQALGRTNGIRSEARRVKVDGKNDFNVETTLGKEMADIYKVLSEKESLLESYGVKTGVFKTLVNKLNIIKNKINNKEKFEAISELPSIFRKNDYKENIEELREFIKNCNTLSKTQVSKIYNIKFNLTKIEHKIEELETYSDFKNILENSEKEFDEYLKDYFNLELLDKIYENLEGLKGSYYHKFRIKHDEYYKKFKELKEGLEKNEDGKIKSIRVFENFKFPNISSAKSFLLELEKFEVCSCHEEDNGEINCYCDFDTLSKAEDAIKGLDEKFNKKKSHLNGIFQRYHESLKNIQGVFENDDEFYELMINLREIESGNYQCIASVVEGVEELKGRVNKYIENQHVPDIKSIEFKILSDKLSEEIMTLGKKDITMEEFNIKINKLIERYKENGYKGIKISQE